MKMYVLTGGPGSGKSSILRYLEIIKGQHVIREAAEDYISLRQAMGDAEPWLAPDFQTHITNLQLQRNERNQFYKVFMDRSVVDNLAYVESGGDIYREMFPHARSQKLEKVFLIENLGSIATNNFRRENFGEALALEKRIEEVYQSLGHQPIRIPVDSVMNRADNILGYL